MSPTQRRARVGVSLMFFTNGALFASLLPRYPEIKAAFDLTNSGFGLLVVAFPLGALLAAGSAGWAIRAGGTLRTNAVGTLVLAAGLAGAGLSGDLWTFAAALVVAGAADGVVDAAQNVQAVAVERWRGRSAINSFHALWSIGAATGGAIGAAAGAAGIGIGPQMVASGTTWAAIALVACRLAAVPSAVPSADVDELAPAAVHGPGPRGQHPWRLLLPLVALAVCGVLVEEVATSWAALFLDSETTAPTGVAGLGLSVAIGAQFVGRLLGDPMTDRWGRAPVARAGGLLIAAGAVAVASAPAYPVALLGFALAGLGCATLVPAAFAAAGRIPGLPEGSGIAVLGWLMRIGALATSPTIGLVADATTLRVAMLLTVLAGLLAAVLAHRLGGARPRKPSTAT